MDSATNLQLPYLIAAQAQKHVTHNEALRALDAIVQMGVLDKDLATPPVSPSAGDAYIVAASPTGAWSGQAGKIAAWQDNAWAFYAPREGWIAWVADEDTIYVYDGSAWAATLKMLGINATADTTNRLAVKSTASLFDNVGNGHQQKINKAAAGDTASTLYQTNYSGRAEYGLTGDDDFHVKVSPDGSAWKEALVVDKTTAKHKYGEGAQRWTLGPRSSISTYPVPFLRPTTTDTAIAHDIMPNGSPSEVSNHGYAWQDICGSDFGDSGVDGYAARVGARSVAVEFGSRRFGSGTVKPLWLTMDDGTPYLVVDTSGNVLVGGATAQSATAGKFELNKSTNGTVAIVATNADTGASAVCGFGGKAVTANGFLFCWGSGATPARYGITLANYTEILSNAGNGLLIGTGGAGNPIVLGNGNAIRAVAAASGNFGVGTGLTPSNKLSVEGIAAPETDNAYTCGTSAKRWSVVYAATGTINTSDARQKTDIADSPLGLGFILELKPRSYRWLGAATEVEWDEETYETQEPVTETRTILETVIEMRDGRAVERQVERAADFPVVDLVPVVDEAGAPVLTESRRPKMHAEPRMRTVTETRKVKREVPREGARTHYGLVAQEVKAALDAAGVEDFAGWVLGDESDPGSTQGLRYDQFIAPLIKAVQELTARVVALEGRGP